MLGWVQATSFTYYKTVPRRRLPFASKQVAKTRRATSPPSKRPFQAATADDVRDGPSAESQWESVDGGALLALPPTPAMVQHCLVPVSALEAAVLPPPPKLGTATAVARIAAFDMDDTLVTSRSGKVFSDKGDSGDWKWVTAAVPDVVRSLHGAGYLIAVFSNQAGVDGGKGWNASAAATVQAKVSALSASLGVPLAALLSTRKDRWRKPDTGMWEFLEEIVGRAGLAVGGGRVDCRCASFYCGDAAGREVPTLAGRKRDFSCSDRKFAHNVGVYFCVPEMVFGGETDALLKKAGERLWLDTAHLTSLPCASTAFTWRGVSPTALQGMARTYEGATLQGFRYPDGKSEAIRLVRAAAAAFPPLSRSDGQQELVLLVGFPACGKTTFYKRFFEPLGYAHVNRDTLKTREKCLRAMVSAWQAGRSVVVDNTNPSAAARRDFIAVVAKGVKGDRDAALPVRVFVFQHSMEEAMHWNEVRARAGLAERIPSIAYFTFRKQFEPYTPDLIRAERVEVVYEVPPVVCFDGLPGVVEKYFFRLYQR